MASVNIQKRINKSDILYLRLGRREQKKLRKLGVKRIVSLNWKHHAGLGQAKDTWTVYTASGYKYLASGWSDFVHDNNIRVGDIVKITVHSPCMFLVELMKSTQDDMTPQSTTRCNRSFAVTANDDSSKCTSSAEMQRKIHTMLSDEILSCFPQNSISEASISSEKCFSKYKSKAKAKGKLKPVRHMQTKCKDVSTSRPSICSGQRSLQYKRKPRVPKLLPCERSIRLPMLLTTLRSYKKQLQDVVTDINNLNSEVAQLSTSLKLCQRKTQDALVKFKSTSLEIIHTVKNIDKLCNTKLSNVWA